MRINGFALCALVFALGLSSAALAMAKNNVPATTPPTEKITLKQALEYAAQNRQELTAYRADLDAAALKLQHAGLPPNPELGMEWDNLGGNLPKDDSRETTISLRQPFEIGGKPAARKNKGQAEIQRLQHEQAVAWLDIAAEVRIAFLEVLGTVERLAIQREAAKVAATLVDITRQQVEAGKLAGTEETRAEAKKAEIAAETQKLQRLLAEAELNLATVLAGERSGAMTVDGRLSPEVPVPDRHALLATLNDSPLLALRRSETRLAKTHLSLEQANAWSDPSLSLAVREVPDEDGRAVAIGVSIPLPLFQRNQVGLADAGATVRKATANEAAATRRLYLEVVKAHENMVGAEQEIRALRSGGLPKAAEAAKAVQEGFRAGKFRYSDVLEASQALMAMKLRHLDTLLDLHRAAIALDRVLGKPAFTIIAQHGATSSAYRSTP